LRDRHGPGRQRPAQLIYSPRELDRLKRLEAFLTEDRDTAEEWVGWLTGRAEANARGPLHRAAHNADLAGVRAWLAAGTPADTLDKAGYTPLQWSCFRGAAGDQAPVVQALLAAGADPNRMAPSGRETCLMLAAQAGVPAVVEALLAAGARVDGAADGVTPLMIAAQAGAADIVEILLRAGADPAIRCGPYDAAGYARAYGHDALAERLESASPPP
jgi:ankyrin repeat protein